MVGVLTRYGKYHTKEVKQKMSQTRIEKGLSKGKKNPMFGISASHGKRFYYKQSSMRSSWEIAFAKYCIINHIKYRYEFKRFYFKDCTYLPDFYLPKTNEYIEIKGYWRDNTKKRFDLFKKNYPIIKINLLMKKELKELGIL